MAHTNTTSRMKRTIILLTATLFVLGATALPASAIIHEIVASHCSGHPVDATVDPPGQLRFDGPGNSFARALQATGVYDIQFGVAQAGVEGLDTTTEPPSFGPMPAPPDGTTPVTVFVDNTRPSAKLGDDFIWVFFVEDGFAVYIQIYELDHPAFEHCPNFPAFNG